VSDRLQEVDDADVDARLHDVARLVRTGRIRRTH